MYHDPEPTAPGRHHTGPAAAASSGATPSARPGRIPWVRVVTFASWLALVAFVVASLGSSLVGRSTFLATDIMTARFQPWVAVEGVGALPNDLPFGAHNPWFGDTVDVIAPNSYQIGREAQEGRLAQWNPYNSGGVEQAGLPNIGMWSPLSLPWWLFPGPFAPAAVKVLEVVVVTAGMSLFLRRLRLPQATWPVASILFLSSGFMVAWTNWPQTRVAALVPLLFWALDRAVTHRSWWNVPIVGGVIAAMVAGGFPAVVALALYYGAAYAFVRALTGMHGWRDRLLGCVRAVAGVALSVLLAGFAVLPFVYNAATVLDFEIRVQGPNAVLPWLSLATAVSPDVLGTASFENAWGPSNPIERFSYMGMAAVVLIAAATLWTRRSRVTTTPAWFFGIAAAVTVHVVYFGGLSLALVQLLPFMNTNPIGRNRVMLGFFVAVLAAYGVAALVQRLEDISARDTFTAVESERRIVLAARWIVAAALGAAVVALVLATAMQVEQRRVLLLDHFVTPAIIGLLVVVACLLVRWGRSRAVAAVSVIAVVALITVPAAQVTRSWWPRNPVESFYAVTPGLEFLQEHLENERFATAGAFMPGSQSVFRLRSVGGRAFVTPQWRELMLAADDAAFLTPTYLTLSGANLGQSIHSPVFDRLGVRYVAAGLNYPVFGEQTAGPVDETTVRELPAGASVTTALQSGPVRALTFVTARPLAVGPDGATATVTVRGVDGETLAEVSTWHRRATDTLTFPLPGETIAGGRPWTAELRLAGDDSSVALREDGDGAAAVVLTRPSGDGLTLVHGGDMVIWERSSALSRVRWAGSELVVPDDVERVAAMADPATPADAVVLEEPADARGLGGDAQATVVSRNTGTDVLTVDVTATGPGWVVFADSLRRSGWSATVDGEPALIADAEHVGGAVFVPGAGEHTVELRFETPWFTGGLVTTIATLGMLASVGGVHAFVRRRRTRPRDVVGAGLT